MKITPQTDNSNIPQVLGAIDPNSMISLNGASTGTHHGSTSHVSGSKDVTPASVPTCMSLSPDSLLAYCESRLQSLDDQMTTIANSQQKNAKTTTDINAIADALNDLPASSSSSSNSTVDVSDANHNAVVDAYQVAIKDAGKSTPLGQQLLNDQKAFETNIHGGKLSSDQLTQLTTNLKNDTATLNSNSETTMITLQSLMSQRQTAIQLTTNLVQSLGDQANDIAKNVGQ
jgi:hypothetical protein